MMDAENRELTAFLKFASENYGVEIHDYIIQEWEKYHASDYRCTLRSPYPETDIRTLWWDTALSIGENPEKFIQDNIKEINKKFDAKQHWINTFGTEPPKDFV